MLHKNSRLLLGVNGDAALNNVALNMPLTVRGALSLVNCQISTEILHYTVNQVASVKMVGCNLNAYYRLVPAVANSTVSAVWSNNVSSIDSPILIDRTNLDPIDSHHTYTYSNNSGGFLPYVTDSGLVTCTIKHRQFFDTASQSQHTLFQFVSGGSDDDRNGRPSGYTIPFAWSNWFDTIRIFRIGTDVVPVRCEVVSYPSTWTAEGSSGEYQYNRVCSAFLGAYFVDGYTFGLQPWWDDMSVAVGSRTCEGRSAQLARGSLAFSWNNMPTFSDYSMPMEFRYEVLDRHD